jgi:hypothetical protein
MGKGFLADYVRKLDNWKRQPTLKRARPGRLFMIWSGVNFLPRDFIFLISS